MAGYLGGGCRFGIPECTGVESLLNITAIGTDFVWTVFFTFCQAGTVYSGVPRVQLCKS